MKNIFSFLIAISLILVTGCSKPATEPIVTPESDLSYAALTVNGVNNGSLTHNYISVNTTIRLSFNKPLKQSSVNSSILFNAATGTAVPFNISFENNDTTVLIRPSSSLSGFTNYTIIISSGLQSISGTSLKNSVNIILRTGIDSADKFPLITDNALLDLVQRQTFKYFWDFGHPVSGLARERNTSGDLVTTGGTGFGIMAIVTAIHRNFITKAEGLVRMQKIVGFLKNNARTFHGAFPHWLNGATGAVIPFSAKDNGADLVETSFLMQGLLTARQYFNSADANEVALRNDINTLFNAVEWSWFRKNNENVLYWHWSPDYNWEINHAIKGWNEALVTYVLAASSPSYSISKMVYDNGWASNGNMRNNNIYFGVQLPLGPPLGGPLFFEHYSFLGINPFGLSDQYANYQTQVINHTKINYEYSKANPQNYYGYSSSSWGLTASDIPNGYTASSPTNDIGVIAPTAALSSMPYTPIESLNALKFFYYKLGDKIWKEYGFVDAFKLSDPWFANSFLAIDQGPIIVMIENYRSGLLWNLFTSCPEVKTGMRNLGFTAPYL
ncbi:MAG: hypothetical protein JWQ96_3047 [Segetibacter sp.]|nr:hypothetical protein [Segetibacter sp.]